MSQQVPASIQGLVNKLNQMGNTLGVLSGASVNTQTVWSELMEALNRALGEKDSQIGSLKDELSKLQAEVLKLRKPEEKK